MQVGQHVHATGLCHERLEALRGDDPRLKPVLLLVRVLDRSDREIGRMEVFTFLDVLPLVLILRTRGLSRAALCTAGRARCWRLLLVAEGVPGWATTHVRHVNKLVVRGVIAHVVVKARGAVPACPGTPVRPKR